MNFMRAQTLSLMAASALLASCKQEMGPYEADREAWLYQSALEMHRTEIEGSFPLNEEDFQAFWIPAKDHECVWFFYSDPDMTRDHAEFVYCFEPISRGYDFRL